MHRQIAEHPLWTDDTFSRGQAWVDLLLLANHKPSYFHKRGARVDIQRGQVGVSIKGLAKRWKWSRGKVTRFLFELENEHQIEHQTTNVTTVVTIVNYDTFQQTDTKTGTRRTPNGHQTDTYKNEKNEKNEKNTPKPPQGVPNAEEFFSRWNSYVATRPKLKPVIRLTAKRRKQIATRLRDAAWWEAFQGAMKNLPLAGDGWQPDFDWLIRNEENAIKVLEGAYEWRNDNPTVKKVRDRRLRQEADERIKRIAEQKKRDKAAASKTRKTISGILPAANGTGQEQFAADLLFGCEDDSSANGATNSATCTEAEGN